MPKLRKVCFRLYMRAGKNNRIADDRGFGVTGMSQENVVFQETFLTYKNFFFGSEDIMKPN